VPDRGDEHAALAEVNVAHSDDLIRADVVGEVDMSNAEEVFRQVRAAAEGRSSVAVDLSQLGFIDSAGIAALARLHRDLTERGARLRVVAAESSVAARTLQLAGMDQVLPMVGADDEDRPREEHLHEKD
jgi:anti-sigma B factor antagonist